MNLTSPQLQDLIGQITRIGAAIQEAALRHWIAADTDQTNPDALFLPTENPIPLDYLRSSVMDLGPEGSQIRTQWVAFANREVINDAGNPIATNRARPDIRPLTIEAFVIAPLLDSGRPTEVELLILSGRVRHLEVGEMTHVLWRSGFHNLAGDISEALGAAGLYLFTESLREKAELIPVKILVPWWAGGGYSGKVRQFAEGCAQEARTILAKSVGDQAAQEPACKIVASRSGEGFSKRVETLGCGEAEVLVGSQVLVDALAIATQNALVRAKNVALDQTDDFIKQDKFFVRGTR